MTLPKLTALILKFVVTFSLLSSSLLLTAQAPTHVGKFDFIDNNINGFWEYLPRNYAANTEKRYPLLIFIHGAGEGGDQQNMQTLERVKIAGVPYLIDQGNFPETFNVGGKEYSFIVISPQIKNGIEIVNNVGTSIIQPSTIEAIITYAKNTYVNRIDESRIYLCGLSMGGGAVWDYAGSSAEAAGKLAAIVVAAGAGDLSQAEANNIAAANLPVIATHNNEDNIVPVSRTQANIARINSYFPAMEPAPKAFYFNTGIPNNHNVWRATFEQLTPVATGGGNLPSVLGVSAYEWMLQNQRANALPVKWESISAAAAGAQIKVEWNVSNERQLKAYEVQRSADGSAWQVLATVKPQQGNAVNKKYIYHDGNPLAGRNHYRIKQTDLDGKFTYSPVKSLDYTAPVKNFRIYPNPLHDKLFISSAEFGNKPVNVEMYSSAGKLLFKEAVQVMNNRLEVTMSGQLAAHKGLLIIRVFKNGETLIQEKVFKN